MAARSRVLIGVGAAALTVSLAACSSSSSGGSAPKAGGSTTPSATPSTPSTADFTALLLSASDVPLPGVKAGTPSVVPQGQGATVVFTANGGRELGDTIAVLPNDAAAQTAAASSVSAAQQQVTAAVTTAAPIGDGGKAIRGRTSKGGSVTVLIFTEGRALVVMEFVGKANDPVPSGFVQQVATAQDTKVKAGLTG
jgi:hypothetical protein